MALGAIGVVVVAGGVAWWALAELARAPVALEVRGGEAERIPSTPPPDRLTVSRTRFEDLPGWSEDRVGEVVSAFLASCRARQRASGFGALEATNAVAPLAAACERAGRLPEGDSARARAFFEELFEPWTLGDNGETEGLITGYYEPELRGARRRKKPFVHPLYLAPRDFQVVDLGDFKADLAGRKVTGMVRGGRFRPYWDRAEIEGGALRGKGLEFLWVDDPVALFFLQIQGSGRVVLDDGSIVSVGYAAQNGHDYTAIGRVLIERGELAREKVSLQSIRDWLRAHPADADAILARNRSYVFFRVLPGAPVGSSGVELTPGRSLAVDPKFLPYGLPLWLDTTYPADLAGAPEGTPESPLRRLVVGQDRGGAIRGPVRGDLYWGPGARAEELAGRMKQRGTLTLLWPKAAGEPKPKEPPAGG